MDFVAEVPHARSDERTGAALWVRHVLYSLEAVWLGRSSSMDDAIRRSVQES